MTSTSHQKLKLFHSKPVFAYWQARIYWPLQFRLAGIYRLFQFHRPASTGCYSFDWPVSTGYFSFTGQCLLAVTVSQAIVYWPLQFLLADIYWSFQFRRPVSTGSYCFDRSVSSGSYSFGRPVSTSWLSWCCLDYDSSCSQDMFSFKPAKAERR